MIDYVLLAISLLLMLLAARTDTIFARGGIALGLSPEKPVYSFFTTTLGFLNNIGGIIFIIISCFYLKWWVVILIFIFVSFAAGLLVVRPTLVFFAKIQLFVQSTAIALMTYQLTRFFR